MFKQIVEAKEIILQNPDSALLFFIAIAVIFSLIIGIPLIINRKLKEFIVNLIAIIFAITGSYFMFLNKILQYRRIEKNVC